MAVTFQLTRGRRVCFGGAVLTLVAGMLVGCQLPPSAPTTGSAAAHTATVTSTVQHTITTTSTASKATTVTQWVVQQPPVADPNRPGWWRVGPFPDGGQCQQALTDATMAAQADAFEFGPCESTADTWHFGMHDRSSGAAAEPAEPSTRTSTRASTMPTTTRTH